MKFFTHSSVLAASFAFGSAVVQAQTSDAFYIDDAGKVGIGTSTPTKELEVLGDLLVKQSDENAILEFSAGDHLWEITQNLTTGRLVFFYPGGGAVTGSFKFDPKGQENLFRVGVKDSETVDINGNLEVTGTVTALNVSQPDYVFDSSYNLLPIEENAEFMWKHKHLPSLPSAGMDHRGDVDLVAHQMGMLEELEKAHIYISELNEAIGVLRQELASKSAKLVELEARLDASRSAR